MKQFLAVALSAFALLAALPAVSHALPDLVVSGALTYDAAPRGLPGSMDRLGPEQAVFIEGMVANHGNGRADRVTVVVRVNGDVVGRHTVGALRSGRDAGFSVRWLPPAEGSYTVAVTVDPDNQVGESNEENNTRTEPLVVAYNVSGGGAENGDSGPMIAADLAVRDISVYPAPRVGSPSTITVEVKNHGDLAAENVEVEFEIEGVKEATRVIAAIPPETVRTVSFNWTPRLRGPRVLVVKVDPALKIVEKDETNNSARRNVEVRNR